MPVVGQEIAGRYRLKRRLGGNELAPVWLATDREGGAAVVLKCQVAAGAEPDARHALAHPALVSPIDIVAAGDLSCVVLPFAAAGDLGSQRGRSCATWLA